MSNESKISKIMNLKLPQEVHNTIRVHVKKSKERDMLQQSSKIDAPLSTIDETRVMSPSNLREEEPDIANMVKKQILQSSRNFTKQRPQSSLVLESKK